MLAAFQHFFFFLTSSSVARGCVRPSGVRAWLGIYVFFWLVLGAVARGHRRRLRVRFGPSVWLLRVRVPLCLVCVRVVGPLLSCLALSFLLLFGRFRVALGPVFVLPWSPFVVLDWVPCLALGLRSRDFAFRSGFVLSVAFYGSGCCGYFPRSIPGFRAVLASVLGLCPLVTFPSFFLYMGCLLPGGLGAAFL